MASCQYAWLARSFSTAALGKAYEHHVGKALPTCSYTKNNLLTASVNCKARVVSCHDNLIMKLVSQSLVGRVVAFHQVLAGYITHYILHA